MQVLGLLIILGMGMFSYKGNKSQEMVFVRHTDVNALASCPDKPNCVSTFVNPNDDHYITPISSEIVNKKLLISSAESLGCVKKTDDDNYLHFECASKLFKFVDDLEILVLEDKKSIHFRSASRVGYSDMDANRKRVDALKKSYNSSK